MSIKTSINTKTKKRIVKGFYLLSVLLLVFVGILTFTTMPPAEYSVLMVAGNYFLFLTTVFISSKLLYNATFSKGLRYKPFSALGISTLGFSLHLTLVQSLQECGYLVGWYAALVLFLALLYNYTLVPTTTKGILIGLVVSFLSVIVPQSHLLLLLVVIASIFIYKQNKLKYRFQAFLPIAISVIVGVNMFWNIDTVTTIGFSFPNSVDTYTKLLFVFLLIHSVVYLTNKPTIRMALYVSSLLVAIVCTSLLPHFLSYQQHPMIDRIWQSLLLIYPILFYTSIISFDAKLENATSFRSVVKSVAIRSSFALLLSLIIWFVLIK